MFIKILSFGRCIGNSNNVVNHLPVKVAPLSKTKGVDVKVFNMMT